MMKTRESTPSTGFPLFLDLFASNLKDLIKTLVRLVLSKPCNGEDESKREPQETLTNEDVKTVMSKLGMTLLCGDRDQFAEEDVERAFDEEDPSLAELHEAFDVFDANKDGFIDASELGRVLCNLGLVKETKETECLRIIDAVDGNGDGLVEFSEFVRLMENCFF